MRFYLSSLLTLLLLLSSGALAAKGVVLMGGQCDYQLLAMTNGGMAVIKLVEGEHPQKHDLLAGNFPSQAFSKVTNQRTGKTINIWVDQVDSSASHALSQYSAYCN